MTANDGVEIIAFESAKQWERWLAKSHSRSSGLWLRFFKKGSGTASVSHAEALTAALCYGWIDGQLKKHDEASWLRKFTPRRANSIWSKRNCELVEQLAEAGKMRPAGVKEMQAAKEDGRWHKAYDSPSKMTVPGYFLQALSKNKKARTFFQTLNRANTYAISWRLQTAKKPETQAKRMQAIIEMLAEGRQFHETRRSKKDLRSKK
jgi:uncharacterized protein YdeI (YjbR/CyaY-like superfamily)